MGFFRKLFSIFHFGTAGLTSRPKINPTNKLPKEGFGAGGNSGFVPSRLFPTEPFCDSNRMEINPATGSPMFDGIDIGDNPYGDSSS